MKAEAFWIDGPWAGRLAILARPRGGDWLQDEVQAWKEAGLDVVVSALEDQEIDELGLEAEQEACRAREIELVSFPMPDRGLPGSTSAVAGLARSLKEALGRGKTVGVHCRQGIGRSGMLTAAVLVESGRSPEAAWEAVGQARGRPVPDTDEQRLWLTRFASSLNKVVRA